MPWTGFFSVLRGVLGCSQCLSEGSDVFKWQGGEALAQVAQAVAAPSLAGARGRWDAILGSLSCWGAVLSNSQFLQRPIAVPCRSHDRTELRTKSIQWQSLHPHPLGGAALSTTPTCQDGAFWLVAPRRLLPIGWAVARWRRLAASYGRHVGANAAAAVPQPGRRDAVYPGPAAARPEHPRREGPKRWAAPPSPGCPRRICGAGAGPGVARWGRASASPEQQRAVRRSRRAPEGLSSGPGPASLLLSGCCRTSRDLLFLSTCSACW